MLGGKDEGEKFNNLARHGSEAGWRRGSLNDRRTIMKGRKRGEEQVYEIMSRRSVCHPLFLFLKCSLSLKPPADVEREREREKALHRR